MSFAIDVAKAMKGMEESAEKFVQNVNIKVFTSIIRDTPVDTGRARGNWQSTENQPSVTLVTRFGDEEAIAEAHQVLSKGLGLFWLSNNLPYIEPLEYGYSDQAPAGMVRKNAARISSILRAEK